MCGRFPEPDVDAEKLPYSLLVVVRSSDGQPQCRMTSVRNRAVCARVGGTPLRIRRGLTDLSQHTVCACSARSRCDRLVGDRIQRRHRRPRTPTSFTERCVERARRRRVHASSAVYLWHMRTKRAPVTTGFAQVRRGANVASAVWRPPLAVVVVVIWFTMSGIGRSKLDGGQTAPAGGRCLIRFRSV